jgi:AcrR family transcriptional regulator
MELGQRPKGAKSRPSETARRILDHARAAFNARGVAAVGIRDLARELALSPGNLSYHFPTKEALIAALVEDAHAINNAVAAPAGPLDFIQLDRLIRTIMQHDVEHRWLMRDAVGLMLSLPALRDQHERLQRAREARVDAVIARLVEARMLDPERTDRALLRLQVLTQVFFWVPSALLAAPDRDPAARLDLHARAALALFAVCATPTGRRQLAPLLGAPRPSPRPGKNRGTRKRDRALSAS